VVVRSAVTGQDSTNVTAHRCTMPQINMITYPVTLNWHWDNQPSSWTLTKGSTSAKFSVFEWTTVVQTPNLPHLERTL